MVNTDPKHLAAKLTQVFVALTLFILGLRVIFRLLDADITNVFVRWIAATSVPLMQPFRGVFGVTISNNTHVLEMPVIFAMMAYAVFGAVVLGILAWLPKDKSAKK
jgi:uncharacterized membrane protein